MNKYSLIFNVSVLTSLLLSSTCFASNPKEENMPEEKSSITVQPSQTPKKTSTHRDFKQGSWQQLTPDEKTKLIPASKDSSFGSYIKNNVHGRQFKYLGATEKAFTSYVASLPDGTVVGWGDGYGRVSIDAFRRNPNIRVVYNDLDPRNMEPFKKFQKLCVKPEDEKSLVAIEGSCLEVPTKPQFINLFPNQDPKGQVSATFGANFLHFMSPEEVLNYFALQFDLLKSGGKTFSIFNNTHVPDHFHECALSCTEKDITTFVKDPGKRPIELSYLKTSIIDRARQGLKEKGVSFYGYLKGEWIHENTGTTKTNHRELFRGLFAKHPMVNFLDPHLVESLALAIGFEVEKKVGLALGPEGTIDFSDSNNPKGFYTGLVLKKPENAPLPSDQKYFRNADEFKKLQQTAKNEETVIRKYFKEIQFKPEYPFFTQGKSINKN